MGLRLATPPILDGRSGADTYSVGSRSSAENSPFRPGRSSYDARCPSFRVPSPRTLYRGDVHEGVLRAVLRRDEPVTLVGVEPTPLTVPRSSVRTRWVDASSVALFATPAEFERELFRARAASASTEVRTRPAATRSGRASSGPSTARPGSRRATSPGCRRRGLVSSHRPPRPPLPPIRAGRTSQSARWCP